MKLRAHVGLALLVALVGAGASEAGYDHPNLARGITAEGVYNFDGLDNVNLFNGNLALTLPIGQVYQVGPKLSYGLVLSYNSTAWDHRVEPIFSPPNQTFYATLPYPAPSTAGLGWNLHLGRLVPPSTRPENASNRWMYVAPDGSSHLFYPTLHEGETEEAGVEYARDGTYLRLRHLSGGVKAIDFPDGVTH
ncbi:MAG: hypothetical protein KDD47_13420, partial [Acidobacteria bacterium]|nr:hypothetical protein [Acidobacteriota bacterium]